MALPAVAGPHGGFAVVVDDVAATSTAFARQYETAAAAVDAASRAFATTAGMAGDDHVMAAWRTRYDTLADLTWLAVGALVASEHSIATMLADTGNAYLHADHHATPGRPPPPAEIPRPGPARRLPAEPPTATGDLGAHIPPDLAEYVPDGAPERLRAAGAAWRGLAGALENSGYDCDAAFRGLIGHNSGRTFSAMDAFWTRRFVACGLDPLYNAVPHTAGTLAHSCDALADLIETTHRDVDNAATDALNDQPGAVLLASIPPETPFAAALSLVGKLSAVVLTDGHLQLARSNYLQDLHELVEEMGPDHDRRLRAALLTEVGSAADPRTDPDLGVRAADVGDILSDGLRGTSWDGIAGPHPDPDSIHVPEERVRHILDGTASGGGHRPGARKPNETEFPPGWTDQRILDSILSVARDPDGPPLDRGNNSFQVEGTRNGVHILVAVRADGYVITAHPVSGPGVTRNPP